MEIARELPAASVCGLSSPTKLVNWRRGKWRWSIGNRIYFPFKPRLQLENRLLRKLHCISRLGLAKNQSKSTSTAASLQTAELIEFRVWNPIREVFTNPGLTLMLVFISSRGFKWLSIRSLRKQIFNFLPLAVIQEKAVQRTIGEVGFVRKLGTVLGTLISCDTFEKSNLTGKIKIKSADNKRWLKWL